MTRIEFHFNTTDRLPYACRLLRKALGRNLRVGVIGAAATLRQLDAALWTFSAHDFLPHCMASDASDIQATCLLYTSDAADE